MQPGVCSSELGTEKLNIRESSRDEEVSPFKSASKLDNHMRLQRKSTQKHTPTAFRCRGSHAVGAGLPFDDGFDAFRSFTMPWLNMQLDISACSLRRCFSRSTRIACRC